MDDWDPFEKDPARKATAGGPFSNDDALIMIRG